MLPLIVAFLLSLIAALCLTPLAKWIAVRAGATDVPNALSIHGRPIPRLGGPAIYVATLGGLLSGIYHNGDSGDLSLGTLAGVLLGATVVHLVGVIEDVKGLGPPLRLALQLGGGLVAVAFGLQWGFVPVLALGVPIAIFYLLAGANAMNLLDGMDGLAAGVSAISSIFFVAFALLHSQGLPGLMGASLAGSALGFLFYNFPRATTFMGDGGSLFLGFILASMALLLTSRPYDLQGLVGPILILLPSVMDTGMAIARRIVKKRPILMGDRAHIYDILHTKGLSPTSVVLIMYGVSAIAGASALITTILPGPAALTVALVEALALFLIFWRPSLLVLEQGR